MSSEIQGMHSGLLLEVNEAIALVSRRCMIPGSGAIESPGHTAHLLSDFTHLQ